MIKTFCSSLLVFAAVGGFSCRTDAPDMVRVNGTVRHFDFEGGFWAVRGDDSVTYDPLGGLPADFQQEGLRVFLEALIRDDMVGIHMAGPIIEIRTLRRL